MKNFLRIFLLFFILLFATSCSNNESTIENIESSLFPYHEALGEAVGIHPGRVVWSYDTASVDWNGEGYWWNPENFNEAAVGKMIEEGIINLTNANNIKEAWSELFLYHNERFSQKKDYQPGQKLAIKVNINGSGVDDNSTSGETNLSYTNPVVLKELLEILVNNTEIKAENITVYDVTRIFPDYFKNYLTNNKDLAQLNFVDRTNAIKDENVIVDWSYDFEGLVTYLPTCVTEADYFINLANLKGHSFGITLTGKNLFGSIINDQQIRAPEAAGLHQFLNNSEMSEYSPIIDLLGHEEIYDKTFLYMLDALICAPSEGIEITYDNSRWQQEPFNDYFTSSIFFSQDSIALDSVGADFLVNETTVVENNSVVGENEASENYLHEASQLNNTPSGIVYQTVNDALSSLGVHEHWNNSGEKLYSKNIDINQNGIELVFLNLNE